MANTDITDQDEEGWLRQVGLRDLVIRMYREIRALRREVNNLKELVMSEQQQLAADAATIETIVTGLNTAVTAIQTEIAALQAANPVLDFTAVNNAISDLTAASARVAAIPPTPAVQTFDPGTSLPLYAYTGTPPAGGTGWTAVTDVTGPGGLVLYTNSGDSPDSPPTFGDSTWVPFVGALTPA